MGVDRTDYLMFGTDIGPDAFERDDFEAEIDGAPSRRFDVVYDGMCGKYAIAGKIIACSDPYEGFELAKIKPEELNVDCDSLIEKISEAFGKRLSLDDFSLVLFSHFS
jgi:hypothetical protein